MYGGAAARSESSGAADAANRFTFELAALISKGTGSDGFVCSPVSAWLPLTALANATDESALDEMLRALRADGGASIESLNYAAGRMQQYIAENCGNSLRIANALFIDKKVTARADFLLLFEKAYSGNILSIDFASPDAVQTVNAWASEHTRGLIPSIVQHFDKSTAAAIGNAIYFSSSWANKFTARRTVEDTFHAPDGESRAMFMNRSGEMPYFEDELMQAVSLPFSDGTHMLVLLPKENSAELLLSRMDDAYFGAIIKETGRQLGELFLPRFKVESGTIDLAQPLISMGVPLFDESRAALSGLIEEPLPVWLGQAVQKAYIDVDENGATAASVTIMAAITGAAIPKEPVKPPFNMRCDKPFLFVIYKEIPEDGPLALFIGMVMKP